VYIGLSAAALAFLVTLAGLGPIARFASSGYSIRDFSMIERVMTQPRVVLFHLSQILVPLPSRFSLEHDFSTSTSLVSPLWTLPALLAVLVWCGLGAWLLSRTERRVAGYFVVWAPLTLIIECTILPLEMVYEHRVYLPSVGLLGLLALLVARAWDRTSRPALLIGGPLLVIVVTLAASTMARVEVWRSDVSLSENSVRNAPRSSRAWSSLGLAYLRESRVGEAHSALRRSLDLNPDNRWALEFMGVILMDQGKLDEAQSNLERVHRAHPSNTSALNHLGELYLKRGGFGEAEEMFGRAATQKPWVPSYHWNRAFTLDQLSRCDEALEEWNRYLALDITPDNKATVLDHLRENFRTLGGSCYSQD
jgi:Tfp pilus assembly protein PilF